MMRWSWIVLVIGVACTGDVPDHDAEGSVVNLLESMPPERRESAVDLEFANGCFDVSVGEWRFVREHPRAKYTSSEPPRAESGALHWLPERVRLTPEASEPNRWGPRHYAVENLAPGDDDPELRGAPTWTYSADTLFVVLTSGYDGSVSRMLRNATRFSGISRPWSDNGGELAWERPIRLERVDCPDGAM